MPIGASSMFDEIGGVAGARERMVNLTSGSSDIEHGLKGFQATSGISIGFREILQNSKD